MSWVRRTGSNNPSRGARTVVHRVLDVALGAEVLAAVVCGRVAGRVSGREGVVAVRCWRGAFRTRKVVVGGREVPAGGQGVRGEARWPLEKRRSGVGAVRGAWQRTRRARRSCRSVRVARDMGVSVGSAGRCWVVRGRKRRDGDAHLLDAVPARQGVGACVSQAVKRVEALRVPRNQGAHRIEVSWSAKCWRPASVA